MRDTTPALDIYDNVWGSIRHWVETAPDLPAIDQEGKIWSYGQLGQAVDRLTYFLGAHEVMAGDRVLFVMENSIGAIAGMLAAMRLGAWAIPLNARLSVREIDEIRKHAGPRLTLYTTDVSKDALAHAERHGAREAPSLQEAGLLYAPADTAALLIALALAALEAGDIVAGTVRGKRPACRIPACSTRPPTLSSTACPPSGRRATGWRR